MGDLASYTKTVWIVGRQKVRGLRASGYPEPWDRGIDEMKQFSTHYDNLQVARNADAAVVAAAYRSLSLKHHPDRNQGNARSEEIMRILNRSYAILSDPAQRLAHDKWIERMEAKASQASSEGAPNSSQSGGSNKRKSEAAESPKAATTSFIKRAGLPLGIAGIVAIMLFISSTPQPSGLPQYETSAPANVAEAAIDEPLRPVDLPASSTELDVSGWTAEGSPVADSRTGTGAGMGNTDPYLRSATAPNGSPWPSAAGYVSGYPRLRSGGRSTVTVDNSANSSDVFVKLVWIDASATRPVRQVFIPANSSFTVSGLKAGDYDVRYKDLTDGSLARSESFTLKEIREPDGVRFSNITMTLYKVANGNMQTYPLAEAEF